MDSPADVKNGVQIPGQRWGSSSLVWVINFGPYNQKRYVSRLVLVPPSVAVGTTALTLFNEQQKVSIAPSGTATGFTPNRVIPVQAGTSLTIVWFCNGGNSPEATLYTEQEAF
jgi:hypothetical protein